MAWFARYAGIFVLSYLSAECGIASRGPYDPRNLILTTMNLNLSLLWESPLQATVENETILYTVIRQVGRGVEPVPHCTNITELSCHLLEFFPSVKDFKEHEYFHVESSSDTRQSFAGRSRTRKFSKFDIRVSAPVIYKTDINSRNFTVWFRGPDTPYTTRKGRYLFMVENKLRAGKFWNLASIAFSTSLIRCRGGVEYQKDRTEPQETSSGRDTYFSDRLEPNTEYTFRVRSSLYGRFSQDVALLEFRSQQEAPPYGPIITSHRVLKRQCDVRNVEITWMVQEMNVNGPLTGFDLVINSSTWDATMINLPSNTTSTILRGLDRWLTYTVYMVAVNAAGQTQGGLYLIEEDDYIKETYRPEINEIEPISNNQWLLTWELPEDHVQCIRGYVVRTIKDEFLEAEMTVSGPNVSTAVLTFEAAGLYLIEVNPIVNDTFGTSVSSRKTFNVPDTNLRRWIILSAFGVLLVIMVLAVYFISHSLCSRMSDMADFYEIKAMALPEGKPAHGPREREVFDTLHANTAQMIHDLHSEKSITHSCHVEDNEDDVFADDMLSMMNPWKSPENGLTSNPLVDVAFATSGNLNEADFIGNNNGKMMKETQLPNDSSSSDYVRNRTISTQSSDSGFFSSSIGGGNMPDSVPDPCTKDAIESGPLYGHISPKGEKVNYIMPLPTIKDSCSRPEVNGKVILQGMVDFKTQDHDDSLLDNISTPPLYGDFPLLVTAATSSSSEQECGDCSTSPQDARSGGSLTSSGTYSSVPFYSAPRSRSTSDGSTDYVPVSSLFPRMDR